MESIELCPDTFDGMPVYHTQPPVTIDVHATHEELANEHSEAKTPIVYRLSFSEYTGTRVDSIWH